MKGILLKDLYIAKSGIIVTLTALFVLAFGLSFLLDASSILMLAPAISTLGIMSLLGMTITLYSLLFNAAIGISAAGCSCCIRNAGYGDDLAGFHHYIPV